jgi:hypothetical protein
MKLTLFCLLLTALSGCASAPAFQGSTVDSHCAQTANHRAVEAGYSGEDADTQQAVFDKVYAECTFWQSKLKSAAPN